MPDLSNGYVPIQPIRDLIAEKLHIEDGHFAMDHPELVCLTRMWDADDRIWKTLNGVGDGKGQEWMEFDVADKLLCLLGLQGCWRDELEDIYLSVNLSRETTTSRVAPKGNVRCARPGCSKVVKPKPNTVKGRQRYCSERCRKYMAEVRAGRIQEPHRNLHARFECINGHEKTPETLTKRGDCKLCIRERNKAYYEKNRARLLAAQNERDRRKAERKAA